MNNEIIETYYHQEDGYNPFFIKDNWQVAQLNYMPEQGLHAIKKVDMHLLTDEVFILTRGTAVLIAATEENQEFSFQFKKMKPGVTYNIPVNAWHNIAMDIDAEIIIVEKSNTHLSDFVYRELSAKDQDFIIKAITRLLNQ
jgi:hypothetical protein